MNWSTNSTTKVTVELHDIIESGVDPWESVFIPSSYITPMLQFKVIDRYYFRQIGQETVGRFLHYFRSKASEIIPYYVEMFKTVEIMQGIQDPFGNVDVTETFEETRTGKETTDSSSEGSENGMNSAERRYSNTPQGKIENIDDYLTEATVESNVDNRSNKTTVLSNVGNEGTTRYTLTKKGNQGVNTYAHDMKEFRETIIRLEEMFIDEFADLFLKIY